MTTTVGQRTFYVPRMCDHALVLAAALHATGQSAEVMPLSDDMTLAIGMEFCRGRECSPCMMIAGDLVRLARQPGFDPARSAIFLATTTGSCRFGQYTTLLRLILDQLAMGETMIVGPTANDSYQGLGENPDLVRRLIWGGAVAVDLLQKVLHRRRPYELVAGTADAVYQQSLDDVVAATEAGGGRALVRAMRRAGEAFAAVRIDDTTRRPLVGVVGEIYLRHNTFSNLEIVRRVEGLGGEVDLTTMIEWLYYTNWGHLDDSRILAQPVEWASTWVTNSYQRIVEHRLARPVAHLLDHPCEPPVGRLMDSIRPYFSPDLANECLLSMGKTIELARRGVCGVINVMPFGCMPGTITAAMAPRIRADLDGLPWLDIAFDSQGGTNITTRLEAFMYQAAEFQRRGHHVRAPRHG